MSKGHDRERTVRRYLEAEGWWVCRAAGSLGDADLVALRGHGPPGGSCAEALLVEVKANHGSPYMNFRQDERKELAEAAEKAGAAALLIHYPPRGEMRFLWEDDWPEAKVAA